MVVAQNSRTTTSAGAEEGGTKDLALCGAVSVGRDKKVREREIWAVYFVT